MKLLAKHKIKKTPILSHLCKIYVLIYKILRSQILHLFCHHKLIAIKFQLLATSNFRHFHQVNKCSVVVSDEFNMIRPEMIITLIG